MNRIAEAFLDKARRALLAAHRELEAGEPEFAAGHAYYGMFYAAEALLAERGLTFASHGAVHGAFGREFAKTGKLDPEYHRWLLAAFRQRQEATYEIDPSIPVEEAGVLIERAERFLAAAKAHLGAGG